AFDQELQLPGLEGERRVDTTVDALQRHVLLDHGRTERDRGDGGADPHRVVGEPDLYAESVAQDRDAAKVRLLRWRRVVRRIGQHDDLLVAGRSRGPDRGVDVGQRRGTG